MLPDFWVTGSFECKDNIIWHVDYMSTKKISKMWIYKNSHKTPQKINPTKTPKEKILIENAGNHLK